MSDLPDDYPDFRLHNAEQRELITQHFLDKMRPVYDAAMALADSGSLGRVICHLGLNPAFVWAVEELRALDHAVGRAKEGK